MHHTKLIDLSISVKRQTWRMNDVAHNSAIDAQFSANRQAALERDDHTCRGCNFMSLPTKNGAHGVGSSFQEVHHLDDNHKNNQLANLATLCPLCHQVFHIGSAGIMNGGTIVWLPELSQADINHLTRSIFVAIATSSDLMGSANALYTAMEARAMYIEDVFASGASDPSFFGQALLDCNPKLLRPEAMSGVRLLAAPARFKDAIQHWSTQSYAGLPPSSWEGLVKQIQQEPQ